MRVTHFTQYNNFILNQQRTLSELNKVQMQISTGSKIQNMYDDAAVFTKHLKLTEEINSLTQVKSSATFAQTFANETDTVMNDFVSTLGTFKTNLLNAANATNDETSRNAIVSELKGLLEHLKDLANTSINGKYLFSGSRFDTKPIDDNFEYQGNSENVKAFLGAGVEREYNIDGASLFLGRDNDYVKHISTNVVQFDKMKANPQFVVRGNDGNLYIDKHIKEHGKNPDSEDVPKNEPVTGESQIRMLTGVEDKYVGNGKYKDGFSYFYVKGRKPNGETFNTKFSLSNSDTVNNLLKKIGEIYGNTAVSKVVDVSLNDMGQIQIKDIQSGKMLTDFYMVASDKDEDSIEDLVKNGDYIVEFQKSDYASVPMLSSTTANNGYFDNRIYKFGVVFKKNSNHENAIPQDKIEDVLGDVNLKVNINGTSYSVTSTQTFQDLIYKIKADGYNAYLKDGELIIEDNSITNPSDTSNLTITMQTTDASGNSIDALTPKDVVNFDKLYMDKSGNEIKGNVSNFGNDYKVILKNGERITEKNEFAQQYVTDNALLSDSILYKSSKTDKVRDIFGNDISSITLKQDDGTSVNITVDGNTTFQDIIDNSNGLITGYSDGVFTTKQNVSITYKDNSGNILKNIGYEKLKINFKDIDGNYKKALIILRDQPYIDENNNKHYSTFWIDNNNDGNIDNDEVYDIFEPDGSMTPAHDTITTTVEMDKNTCTACKKEKLQKGMTYRQLGDVISMLTSGNLPTSNSADDYNKAINAAKEKVSTGVDDKGRFYLKDKSNNSTKIDLSIYTENNSLYFQANNAITIDEPQVDFFDMLQKAIDAVKNGNNYPDSEKNPRSFGIQGAIEAIDHVTDHVRRLHAKIGAVSNEFNLTIERTEMLTLNVQQLQSENIDTDIGEATMKLNSLQVSYQALLASIAKVNKLTLLNYL